MVHTKHKYISKGILCFFVALSFFSTLVPIAGASHEGMPCCVGSVSGPLRFRHTSGNYPSTTAGTDVWSRQRHYRRRTFSQRIHDSLSRTAETTSHAAESNSLSKPCQMECGTCAASSTRQQRRERGVLQPATYQNPSVTVHSRFQSQPLSFSSNEDWEQTSPRGLPADLL